MKSLTILATPINAVGHVNAVSGALKPLLARGHRVIFVMEEAFEGKLSLLGFEEEIFRMEKDKDVKNPGEAIGKLIYNNKMMGDFSVWEKFENLLIMFHGDENHEQFRAMDVAIKEAIKKYSPDAIYFDGVFLYPTIHYSGIPWILNYSTTPITYEFDETNEIPPGCSGFPSNGNRDKFDEFNKLRRKLFFSSKANDLIERLGYKRYPDDNILINSNILTVYGYPNEINYPYFEKKNWFNLEVFNKRPPKLEDSLNHFIPDEFFNSTLNGKWSGKWIYLSMGSMGSFDLELMSRLIDSLKNTPHKYIVSKGPRHNEYSLPENMYGDRYLPQTSIIPFVDLVISHGGNNTVTEVFAVGKPLIILPLFGDQFDNAQRLHETGYGIRLEPYKFTSEQLVTAIDKLLYDQTMNDKLKKASERIQNENQHEMLADKIEELLLVQTNA
ncbi:hypothetical protein RDWZM_008217 [Blomia tropicalis]|uniref:Glycosyl transferase family 28 C-terminal domain-containing protein n=1 Tax=Blomia tropicalis TaxID=40697 RepID=A0A9Q0RK53_BLOTA|nr:hypothetical protein RDWZM_008217 [Blomia tropicalis]